jgi:hypothetical protein
LIGFYDVLKGAGPARVRRARLRLLRRLARLFAPASSLLEGLTTIGFFAFFIFLAATGIAILRRRGEPSPEAAPAPVV